MKTEEQIRDMIIRLQSQRAGYSDELIISKGVQYNLVICIRNLEERIAILKEILE